jgi:PAS domain S-box-containing protein
MLSKNNLYRLMLDDSSDPNFIFDSDYRYIYANQALADGIGKNLQDVMGKTLWDVFSEDEAAKRFALVKWVFENKETKTHEMWVSRHGVDHYYLSTLRPILGDHGRVIAVSANSKDITKRKLAEELLRLNEERLARMQVGANDAFWDLDLVNNQMFYSLRWWTMLGYSGKQTSSDPDLWRRLLHPDDAQRVNQAFIALMDDDITFGGGEFRLLHQDGHYVSVECRGVIERNQDGKAIRISGANTDLTERKLAEARLLSAKAEAELANQAKSRFLAAASHDLRQPLGALTLYVDVLKGRSTAQDIPLISKIETCCTSLSELLTDLLDVSKLDAGTVVAKVSDFAIDDLLESLVQVHSAEANVKGLRLRLRPSPGVIVRTDPTLLSRIVGNLLSNAIRFTHTGGVLVACRHHAKAVSLEVWDTGIGIAPDKTKQVFEEFYKLDEARSASGSGLGLSIVSKAAALLGLPIRLRSKIGQGSMFAIEVPIGHAGTSHASISRAPHGRRLRIGLVEDNPQLMEAMVLSLEIAGYEVVAATTGKDLITALNQRKPDIVISDYRLLAGETGFHVVHAVRAVFDNALPAIIITGDTDPTLMREMAGHSIAIHYKPLHLNKLRMAISEATERRTM